MKEQELRRLLERYYNGESSEREEDILREYFTGDNVFEGFEAEWEIFSYYCASTGIPEPSADFEDKIIEGIEAISGTSNGPGILRFRRYIFPYLSIAAGLLILAGSYFFFINRSEPKDTFSDPQIAYAETMKILLEVSSKLNRGTQALEPVGKINMMKSRSLEPFNKTRRIIEKNFKSIGTLQKGMEVSKLNIVDK